MEKVTFKETVQDFTASTFSLEAPILITLNLLIVNPGKLFSAFLSGKRKTYYKPVSFFILTTVVYLLIRSIIDYDPLQDTFIQVSGADDDTNLILAHRFMLENYDKMLLIFVFILGLFMKIFFYSKHTLAEFIAISFYLIGGYTIIAMLNMFYVEFVPYKFQSLPFILMLAYFIFAMLTFFKDANFFVFLKSFVLFLFAFIFFYLFAFGISNIIIFLKNL